MKHTTIILATIALSVGATAYASTGAPGKLWLRDAAISPQGDRIAFTYGGDIWTVPSSGGAATRLTTLPSYEDRPVWSPDGRLIAFASDRYGSPDIFVMDSRGGQAARLTSNSAAESPEAFSPDGYEVYYSAYIQAPTLSINAPSSRMTQLYSVPAQGGLSRQVLGTPATDIAFTGRGDSFLYEDVKGMEDKWRKHHTSSVSRDVWLYDATTGRHSNLTARPGEDRNPVFDPATETVFFLSERTGGGVTLVQRLFLPPGPSRAGHAAHRLRHPPGALPVACQ